MNIYLDSDFRHFVCGRSTTEEAMGNMVLKLSDSSMFNDLDVSDIKLFGVKASNWLQKARNVTEENKPDLDDLAQLILDVREGKKQRPKRKKVI